MSGTSVVERPRVEVDARSELPPARGKRRGLRPPSLTTLVGLCLALAAWTVQLRPLLDNSFLWHLRTGHWILDHGVPRHDIFSFTAPGTPWVVQSWLAEALYAAIDRAVGPFGLQVLRGGVCALLTYLMFILAVRLTGDRVRGLLVTLPALGACVLMWNERPLLLGALGMLALVWVVEAPNSWIGRRPLVALPVLFWLWANVHGSFALGMGYVAVHVAGRWLDGSPPWAGRERTLVAATGLALVACMANPLGLSLLTFPVHLLSRGEVMREIVEWKSPDLGGVHGMLFAAFAALTVVALTRGRERVSRRDVLVALVFLGLGFWAVRNVVVVPLVCLPIVARAFATGSRTEDRRPVLHWGVLAAVLLAGVTSAVGAAGRDPYRLDLYPVEAMAVVENEGLLGRRLLTTDGWGGFVIYRYWPRQQVFIDDRYDMYPVALAEEYFDLDAGRDGWSESLERHRIDVVVWKAGEPLAELLDGDEGWRRMHTDDLAGVWVRS